MLEPLVNGRTIFVTHTPARGSLDLVYEENVGSLAIARFLQRKQVLAHIHGHIHTTFGRDHNRFNVASAGLCRAISMEIPSLTHDLLAYDSSLLIGPKV